MKDFDLEQWLEREAVRWYCKDQATIAKSSCLKGFNKAKELYEPRWISVEEAPDLHIEHLVLVEPALKVGQGFGQKMIASYNGEWDERWINSLWKITHWMPLPPKPKTEG
jgi:hypothetical protein